MTVELSNIIKVINPTQEIRNYCHNNLILDNPDYFKKERMGKWTGNTPMHIQLYEQRGDSLYLPYGCRDLFRGNHVWGDYPYISEFRADYNSTIDLYPYQKEARDAMIKKQYGVVVMPCGSGKTQTALDAVANLRLKALWLTHTQDLLTQSMNRAKACFNCDSDMFGTITAGKVNISKGITFATVQTMCKLDLSQYKNEWAVIVVDECQHCCGSPTKVTQFYKVVNSLFAPYKFGLTATPNRTDGLEKSMYALLGDKIVEVGKECVAERTCPVKVEPVYTEYFPSTDDVLNGDGTINYSKLTTDLISDSDRMQLIVDKVNELQGQTIVLANRVEYLRKLCESVQGKKCVCLSAIGTSKKAREERKDALTKLNSGELDCIFATYQLAAEGLDCPELRYVVFATPEKNERTVTQAVGRVARKVDGKEYGTVIDFVDGFGMYKSWHNARNRVYKRLNCGVEKTDKKIRKKY